jgi:hypothetical protein
LKDRIRLTTAGQHRELAVMRSGVRTLRSIRLQIDPPPGNSSFHPNIKDVEVDWSGTQNNGVMSAEVELGAPRLGSFGFHGRIGSILSSEHIPETTDSFTEPLANLRKSAAEQEDYDYQDNYQLRYTQPEQISVKLTSGGGLSRVSSAGGTSKEITKTGDKGEVTHRWPQILPGGQAGYSVVIRSSVVGGTVGAVRGAQAR